MTDSVIRGTADRIIQIIAEYRTGNLADITRESSFDDLGIDEINIELIFMDVWRDLLVHIPNGEAEKITTVGQLIKFVTDNKK